MVATSELLMCMICDIVTPLLYEVTDHRGSLWVYASNIVYVGLYLLVPSSWCSRMQPFYHTTSQSDIPWGRVVCTRVLVPVWCILNGVHAVKYSTILVLENNSPLLSNRADAAQLRGRFDIFWSIVVQKSPAKRPVYLCMALKTWSRHSWGDSKSCLRSRSMFWALSVNGDTCTKVDNIIADFGDLSKWHSKSGHPVPRAIH